MKQPEIIKGCIKKQYFKTFASAKFIGDNNGLRAYKCKFCNGYHLTSKNNKKVKTVFDK